MLLVALGVLGNIPPDQRRNAFISFVSLISLISSVISCY
jgi:hypothetical protein